MKKSIRSVIFIITVITMMITMGCNKQKQAEKELLKFLESYYYNEKTPADLIQDSYKTDITLEDLQEIFTDEVAEVMYYVLNKYTDEDKINQIEKLSQKYDTMSFSKIVKYRNEKFPELYQDNYLDAHSKFLIEDCHYDNCKFINPKVIRVGLDNTFRFGFIYVNNKFILYDRLFYFFNNSGYVIKDPEKDIKHELNDEKEYPNFENYFLEQIEEQRIEMVRSKVRFESPDKIDLSTFYVWNSPYPADYCGNGYYDPGTLGLREEFAYIMWEGINQQPVYENYETINWSEIEEFVGLNVILSKDIHTGLNQYNPAFINWITQNLIPDPNSKGRLLNKFVIKSQLYQDAYSFYFQKLVREYAKVYQELQTNNMIGKEKELYIKEMHKKDFEGPEYLMKKYPGCSAFIYGFWLRRNMDGTSDACWNGLKKVMTLYDKDYFNKEFIGL